MRKRKMLAFLLAFVMAASIGISDIQMYKVYAEDITEGSVVTEMADGEENQEETNSKETGGEEEAGGQITETSVLQMQPEEMPQEQPETGSQSIEAQDDIHIVEKSEGASESALTSPVLTSLNVKDNKVINALTAPDSFTVEVGIKAPADMKISEIELVYSYDEGNRTCSFNRKYADNAFCPGENGAVCEIQADISKYSKKGAYRLDQISIISSESMYTYRYDAETKKLTAQFEDLNAFEYNGNVDYNVAVSKDEDNSAPGITSISRVSSGEVYTNSLVEFQVGYTEVGSGVKEIALMFTDSNGNPDWVHFNANSEEESVGTGCVTASSNYRSVGKYELDSAYIEDYAGNTTFYSKEDGVDGFSNCGYTVQYKNNDNIRIKSIQFEDGVDKDNLSAGTSFNVKAVVSNETEKDILVAPNECFIYWHREWNSGHENGPAGKGNPFTLKSGEEAEIEFYPITISLYAPKGARKLSGIDIMGDGSGIYYHDPSEEGHFVPHDSEGNELSGAAFEYKGEVDYTVTVSNEEDASSPEITSLKRITTGEIYTNSTVEYEVGYQEEGSGIKDVNLWFGNMDGYDGTGDFSVRSSSAKQYIGTGTVCTRSSYRERGNYQISSVSITDYGDNTTDYYWQEDKNALVAVVNGEEKVLEIDDNARSYSVQYAKVDIELCSLQITGVDDKNNLSTGDSFNLEAVIRNNTENNISLDPKMWSASWRIEDAGDPSNDYAQGDGNEFILEAGKEAKLIFPVTVNAYGDVGARKFNMISSNGVSFIRNGNQLTVSSLEGEGASLEYNGEADFNVTTAATPDSEAPYFESMSIVTEDIKVPGKVEFAIKVSSEGYAKAKETIFSFTDVNNPKNQIIIGGKGNFLDLSYSEEKRAYICTGELLNTVINGTYILNSIALRDEAGNYRVYDKADEKTLVDSEGHTAPACEMVITQSAQTDRDFDGPVLKSFELLNNEVQAGGSIQLKINAEDASGLANIRLNFWNQGNNYKYVFLESSKITRSGDSWICVFPVDEYCEANNYMLSAVTLWDNSVRNNSLWYSYDNYDFSLKPFINTGQLMVQPVIPTGSVNLKITQPEDVVFADVNTEDVAKVVETVGVGGTVALKNESADYTILPEEFVKIAKEKDVTVVVLGNSNTSDTSQLIIEPDSLPADIAAPITLKIQRGGMLEEQVAVGNARDDIYYPVDIVTSNADIPVKARIKLDNTFLRECKGNSIRLSKMGSDGSTVLLQDNLQVGDDGYVEISFANGLSGNIAPAAYAMTAYSAEQSAGNEAFEFIISSKSNDGSVTRGDINGDGEVTMADLMMCLHHVSGRSVLSGAAFDAADIDGDGYVKMSDLMKILHFVSGRITTL